MLRNLLERFWPRPVIIWPADGAAVAPITRFTLSREGLVRVRARDGQWYRQAWTTPARGRNHIVDVHFGDGTAPAGTVYYVIVEHHDVTPEGFLRRFVAARATYRLELELERRRSEAP